MTGLAASSFAKRGARFVADLIVIELHATALFVRTKGSRESFPIAYTDLYEIAAMRDAKCKTGFVGKPQVSRCT
jgi:hypothetical protein